MKTTTTTPDNLQSIHKAKSLEIYMYEKKPATKAIAVGDFFLLEFYDPYLNSGQRFKIDTKWMD